MNSQKIKYGSLFTGIGGFDLGFDEAGMECAWQVEQDKHCVTVLNKHWPDVPKYEDVRNVGRENLKPVDLICGGFPCQDVSVAGNRAGLAGERSGLWFEFLRVITELKPTWVVIENVPGLLSSHDGRDFAAILRGLEQCGYWWAYRILDSQYFGVPQRRRRVFIVGCLTRGLPQKVLFEPESSPWDTPPGREKGKGITGTIAAGAHPGDLNGRDIESGVYAITERTRAGDRNLEMQPDIAYTLTDPGSGGRPHSRLIAFQQNIRDEVRLINGDGQITGALSAQPGMKQQTYIAATKSDVATSLSSKNNRLDGESDTFVVEGCLTPWDAESKRIHTGPVIPTLAGSDGKGGQRMPYVTTALNASTGGPDDNGTQGNKLIIGFDASRGQYTGNIAAPLRVNGAVKPGVNDGKPDNMAVSGTFGVRRLTPLECERLQGFPDGWTEYGVNDIIDLGILLKENQLCPTFAEWKTVIEESLSGQRGYVSSTINAGKSGAIQVSSIPTTGKIQAPVSIVIEMPTAEKCVCDITSPGTDMVMLYSLTKTLEIEEETKKKNILEKMAKLSTKPLWKITLGENLSGVKLSIILTWIQEIMKSQIFTFASREKNIIDVIIILSRLPQNSTKEELLHLRMGSIIPQSDTQRYRQLGNAVTVNVTRWLGRRIIKVIQE